jgi:hypothetical protein
MDIVPQWAGLGKALSSCLSSHGHAFQHAMTQHIAGIEQGAWKIGTVEHPVLVGRHETKVDLVLINEELALVLAIEFKRVRAGGVWVFFNIPTSSHRKGGQLISAAAANLLPQGKLRSQFFAFFRDDLQHVAHLGVQVVTRVESPSGEGKTPDPQRGTQPIEEAAGQATLGVNGLLAAIGRAVVPGQTDHSRWWLFFPLVVTTAPTVWCNQELAGASIDSGTIEIPDAALASADYVMLQYPVSVSRELSPSLVCGPVNLGPEREVSMTRSVFVTTGIRLQQFLETFNWRSLREVFDLHVSTGSNSISARAL